MERGIRSGGVIILNKGVLFKWEGNYWENIWGRKGYLSKYVKEVGYVGRWKKFKYGSMFGRSIWSVFNEY